MASLEHTPLAILGAGSWGTALALNLSRRGIPIRLWSIEQAEIDALRKDQANHRFLPGFTLPSLIEPVADLTTAVHNVEDILIVVPSHGFRGTLQLLKPHLTKQMNIISATKGLDESGKLLHELIAEIIGSEQRFAVLSGPSFAREVAAGLPTAVALASFDNNLGKKLLPLLDSPNFRIHLSTDVIGVEIGGTVKNIFAIATGICDGLGLGANARSALLTYSLAEMVQLGRKLGASADTFLGLSGVGDLILTCLDDQSRNRRLGLALGKGQNIKTAEQEIGQAIEGKRNAEIVSALAQKHHLQLPICFTVREIVQGTLPAKAGLERIFANSV